jgi:hypothetical protein
VLNIKQWIKIKIGDNNEINPCELIPGLTFLGEATAPVITNSYNEFAGADGSEFNYAVFSKSTVNVNFRLLVDDFYELKLVKHDIYKMFMTKQLIRIRTSAEPAKVKFVRAGNFDITPQSKGAMGIVFTIPFENPSGLKYSLANSDVLKEYGQNAWQYGENLPNGKDLQYQFVNQTKFSVYNASDIPVDPYFQRHELKIIIKHNGGAFGVQNETTGDLYRFNGSMNSNDTLMIDGINSYLNGDLADNQTNYGYISFATGWNYFKIISATDLDITFSFPFIYLG